ncbi:IL-6 subfamily cytokine M17 [Stigmatopora argus]
MTNACSVATSLKKHKSPGAHHEETQAANAGLTTSEKLTGGTMVGRRPFQRMETRSTLSAVLLLLLVTDAASSAAARQCSQSVRRIWKLTRLALKESTELLKIYKASQGAWSDDFCEASLRDVPEPDISGPESVASRVLERVLVFRPHLRRVYEQQEDLQPPASPLLQVLKAAWVRNRDLGALLLALDRDVSPETAPSVPGPPPVHNVFAQKVYGCVLLKNYKAFLIRAARELRTLKGSAWRTFRSVGSIRHEAYV